MTTAALNLHAACIVVGERGVLIRGLSGAGKTRLALAAVAEASRHGGFARLVADDRTLLMPASGRLVARPHPALAGLAERRGLGLVEVPHEPACVLALVVDLVEGRPPRWPDAARRRVTVGGIALDALQLEAGGPSHDGAAALLSALSLSVSSP